jgi:hypothetical protein
LPKQATVIKNKPNLCMQSDQQTADAGSYDLAVIVIILFFS